MFRSSCPDLGSGSPLCYGSPATSVRYVIPSNRNELSSIFPTINYRLVSVGCQPLSTVSLSIQKSIERLTHGSLR